MKLGYSERNADIRIAQYESGKRTLKEDVINGIAHILEVSLEALKIPDIENHHGFMFTLFEFEEQYGLTIDKAEGMPYLRLDNNPINYDHSMKEMLDDWYACKSKLASGEMTNEEYTNWKLNYPDNLIYYLTVNRLKNSQRNRSILIRGIKMVSKNLKLKKMP